MTLPFGSVMIINLGGNLCNWYKENNYPVETKQQFFSKTKLSLFSDLRSANRNVNGEVYNDFSNNFFGLFQLKFGYKWVIPLFASSIVFGYLFLALLNQPLINASTGIRSLVALSTMLATFGLNTGLLGISTVILKHSKKYRLPYKLFQIQRLYEKLAEFENNKEMCKAIENKDLDAFEVQFNKMKQINEKINKLMQECVDIAKNSKSKNKQDVIGHVNSRKSIVDSTNLTFDLFEYRLEKLQEQERLELNNELNDTKGNNNVYVKSQNKENTNNNELDDEFTL